MKVELQRRRAQQAPKESSERTFFYKFTSPEQSYSAALLQDTQHQPPQTDGKACGSLCSSICHNRKFRKKVSVQAPSLSSSDMLKIATVV
jgi:hypothetical protein